MNALKSLPRAAAAGATPPWPAPLYRWGALALLLALLVWSHWHTLSELWTFWQFNDDYSAGQLVPLFAALFIWQKRKTLNAAHLQPSLAGLWLLIAAEGLRGLGLYYEIATIERGALLAALAGVVLLSQGWQFARPLRWVFAFLFLAIPLPGRVHDALAVPLQNFSTLLAQGGLELCGIFVQRQGNVLTLNDQTLVGVTGACSGLRMMTAFVIVSAVAAFLVRRPAWQRIGLLAAGIPIAVVCNTVRAITTALLVHGQVWPGANQFMHDSAGLLMMPLAIALLIGWLWLMGWLNAVPDACRPPANAKAGTKVGVTA